MKNLPKIGRKNLKKIFNSSMKIMKRDGVILLLYIFLFIAIRTIYYSELFKFIYDQAQSSTEVFEYWQSRRIPLLGPPMSLTIENRQIFFGGVSYIIQFLFLYLGNWNPFFSTYLFMIFSSFMIVPLYYGVKKIINSQVAVLMLSIYTLMPFYIEGTTQLWNPYFQLALMPLFILLMALFEKNKKLAYFFAIGVFSGIQFQLHYQFIVIIIGLAFYYVFWKKLSFKTLFIGCIGLAIGTVNLIVFELRNNFYLFRTIGLFLHNPEKIAGQQMSDYYIMSILFLGVIPILFFIQKYVSKKINLLIFIVLLGFAIEYTYISASTRNYPKDWTYSDDLKVFEIIQENYLKANIRDINVFQFYSSTGATQKYYMKIHGLDINYEDYYHNKYLYVLYKNDEDYMKDPAYEVGFFRPNVVRKSWKITNKYSLYLLERI